MKKQLLVLGLLAVASASYGKEVMMVNAAMPIEEIVVVNNAMPVEDEKFFDNFYFKVGLDVGQDYAKEAAASTEVSYSTKDTSGTGWFAALEATRNMTEEFELGIGLGYQAHSDGEMEIIIPNAVPNGSWKYGYDSIPLYFVGKYKFEPMGEFIPYVKGVAGFTFNSNTSATTITPGVIVSGINAEVDNGLYYGAGVGLQKENIALEVMYEVNKADIRMNETLGPNGTLDVSDANYSRITLGITFSL